jgi:hypothetical protein
LLRDLSIDVRSETIEIASEAVLHGFEPRVDHVESDVDAFLELREVVLRGHVGPAHGR